MRVTKPLLLPNSECFVRDARLLQSVKKSDKIALN